MIDCSSTGPPKSFVTGAIRDPVGEATSNVLGISIPAAICHQS